MTAEEAKKLNEDAKAYALAEKEKREPFYRYYQDIKLDSVCFQGTIRAISTIPDPEKNDYDDCLYALLVEIDALLSDVTTDTEIASEGIVNVPIMKNKTVLQDNQFQPGDKVWCTCAEYDAMPQEIQEIQLSDDIQSFEHQQYYSIAIHKISSFQKDGNRNFAKREITILPIQTLPKDEKATALRKERIQNEIARIEEEIKKHGGSFEKWKEEYKPIAEKYKQLSAEGYKGWIGNSFFAAGGSETLYDTQLFLKEILPYNRYLQSNNIDFIIVRIPSKWDFAARVLASEDFQENPAWIEHYYECLKNDIEIIDPMPEMWNHRFEYPLFYFYHIPSETHPFEGQSLVTSKILAEVLSRYDYKKTDKPITLEDIEMETTDPRYFWPKGNDTFDPAQNIVFKQTVQNGKPVGNLTINTGSPFLFLSNSFFWYPQRSLGASVPGYTSYFIQHVPDWIYQNGDGNGLLRTLVSKPEQLSFRKNVIMVGPPWLWTQEQPQFPPYLLGNKITTLSLDKTLNDLRHDIKVKMNDSDSFLFSFNEKNELEIKLDSDSKKANIPSHPSYSFVIDLPHDITNKHNMVRLVFDGPHIGATYSFKKTTGQTIADNFVPPSSNVDFFPPVESAPYQIEINVTPFVLDYEAILKKIEIWSY